MSSAIQRSEYFATRCCCFLATLVQLLDKYVGLGLSVAVNSDHLTFFMFLNFSNTGLKQQRFTTTFLANYDQTVAFLQPLTYNGSIFFQFFSGIDPLDSLYILIFVLTDLSVLNSERKRIPASWYSLAENCLKYGCSLSLWEIASYTFDQF